MNRVAGPRRLPRLDFSKGVPEDCKTFIVIPTLLLSRSGSKACSSASRFTTWPIATPSLLFGLLTDFADAPTQTTEKDEWSTVRGGIRALNDRYGSQAARGPFYLFHRGRQWNESEGVWMGHERKRGKLDDFNEFLLGRGDHFSAEGRRPGADRGVRYIITLDTDTQLAQGQRARELIATMAHPLNRPVLDASQVVRQGYALLQPRVSVSMESARKSRLANLYSGQTGLDPYTKAVSDVYQDLFGQASYTGKGIYELATFARVTQGRFPENTLLSHDLIEGEHVRVGLVTDMEVIDDFPATLRVLLASANTAGCGAIGRSPCGCCPGCRMQTGIGDRNPLSGLSRWKIFDNLRRSLYELSRCLPSSPPGCSPRQTLAAPADSCSRSWLFPAFAQTFFTLHQLSAGALLARVSAGGRFAVRARIARRPGAAAFLLHQALLMTDAFCERWSGG